MDRRTRKIYLGKSRHNLKNPINGILGYSEMLIEDCEDYNLESIIPDLEKIYNSGKSILQTIEENFHDSKLNEIEKPISEIAKETQILIRTPLNTIIGYSELISEDSRIIKIQNFISDLEKIIMSSKALENEINTIINFNSNNKNISEEKESELDMVKDVLKSIKPIDKELNNRTVVGKILAVDDNINNTDLLQKRLIKIGHRVDIANNGKDALNKLSNDFSYDIILLDIVMPLLNGFEVLKVLKNDKRFYSIPVIMISSMDDTDSIYRCIELGADDYITKPFEKSILDARIISCIEKKQLRDKEKALLKELAEEKEKSDSLLLNILPYDIAKRLKNGENEIADNYDNVTIIFTDLIDFTSQANKISAPILIRILNKVVRKFDDLTIKYSLEKIKTIGDSYFAIGSLTEDKGISAINIIKFSKSILLELSKINKSTPEMDLNIRIGVHTGSIVAGIIGKNKFSFDLWGAAVNKASRLETSCPPGRIHISKETKDLLGKNYKYEVKKDVEMKGLGKVDTYIVI